LTATVRRRAVWGILAAACVGALLVAAPATARKPDGTLGGARPVSVSAQRVPLDRDHPERTRFGKLVWLGTLELSSPAAHFGGYSGLAVSADGKRLTAVSDAGTWLTAEIAYRDGRMKKVAGAVIGPLRARNGKPLRGRHIDAEAIAIRPSGAGRSEAVIAFEHNHRIGVFPVKPDGPAAPKRYLALPARAKGARGNTGLEAIAVLRAGPAKGAVLALSEEYLDEAGNHLGWLIGGKQPGQLTVKRIGGFVLTGAASLPNGDVVLLERRFRFAEGIRMRLRRIRASSIRPGAVLDGEVLLAADNVLEIDNMEGLAAHRDGEGRTILTLISDDNFNHTFQRTLLMQFALPE
jgi:hypothetical protein